MEFRLLGPVEAGDSGVGLPLGGGKRRALLALLLLNADRVVPVERIVDGLWGDGSGYVGHAGGADFERYVVEEVPACAAEAVPGGAVGPGSPLFIAGLSMGGFGALRIGAILH